jgi:hypothetical protein
VSDTPRPDHAGEAPRSALDSDRIRAGLDLERRMVAEAILLVSSGGSRRVTVAGLSYAEQILESSRPLAVASHVRLVALWTDDERGADVAVEALDEDER